MLEFLGCMPLVLLAAASCLQALLVALTLVFAQGAADRAARGASRAQALDAVPAGWRPRARMQVDTEQARVTLRPPAVIPGAARVLAISASTSVAP
jgi:hypothetical protein